MFNRTLNKYNKGAEEQLDLTKTLVLLAVNYHTTKGGATMQNIEALLKKNNRTRSRNDLAKNIKELEKQQLIVKTNSLQYRLTIAGRNTLNTLELKLRAERLDR